MSNNLESMNCQTKSWLIAAAVGGVAFILMAALWGWGWFFSLLLGVIAAGVLGFLISQFLCSDAPAAQPEQPTSDAKSTSAPEPTPAQSAVQEPMPAATPADMPATPDPLAVPQDARPLSTPESAQAPVAPSEPSAEQDTPPVMAAPRGAADDLRKIKGLGPKLEEKLNALGIWHYDQIANWTEAHVAWADEQLSARGRVARDDWVGQARALSAGKDGG